MEENEKKLENEAEDAKQETQKQENPLILKLADPYKFDGIEVTELNMEGITELTAGDMCQLDREMIKRGYSGTRMDATRQYAMLVAAKVNGKPVDYCDRMGARDSIRLRDFVATFFYTRG